MRKNNKGIIIGGLVFTGVAAGFAAAYTTVALAAFWHIPAYEKAKAEGKTKEYQQTEQWPQQLFDKLPGGTPNRKLGG